jgi:hypothetical protein
MGLKGEKLAETELNASQMVGKKGFKNKIICG